MAIPRKRIMALTVSVWLAVAGSAAALTYELNRPLVPQAPVTAPSPALGEQTSATLHEQPTTEESPAYGSERVLYVEPVKIVGHIAHRAPWVSPRNRSTSSRDIEGMHCTAWRDLDMGSGHVQVCE